MSGYLSKQTFIVAAATVILTSLVWLAAYERLFAAKINQLVRDNSLVAVGTLVSFQGDVAALVVHELDRAHGRPRKELLRFTVPAGEERHFEIRTARTLSER